ncbi:MAG: hypothetical protein KBT11_04935 [Treponema sp.]|nr:hypothetical protein [Candidatus Treponema equifaecale]
MKRLFAFLMLGFFSLADGFSDDYLNFTVGFPFGYHFQDGDYELEYLDEKNDPVIVISDGFNLQFCVDFRFTAEYFHSFGESSFGLGAKVGASRGVMMGEFYDFLADFDSTGFLFAPGIGWVFGETTKKKINIYPCLFQYYKLTNGETGDECDGNKNVKLPDSSVFALRTGASFSWQWGSKFQNGFELGFNVDWCNWMKFGDCDVVSGGSGIEFYLAYKFSIGL